MGIPQTRIRLGEWDAKIFMDFEIKTDYLTLWRSQDLMIIDKNIKLPKSVLCPPSGPVSEN